MILIAGHLINRFYTQAVYRGDITNMFYGNTYINNLIVNNSLNILGTITISGTYTVVAQTWCTQYFF